jgi:hypothetical protein
MIDEIRRTAKYRLVLADSRKRLGIRESDWARQAVGAIQ